MKYTEKQIIRMREIEFELQGELQKSVWSIIKQSGKARLRTIANKTGRRSDSIHTSIARLIELKLVDKDQEKRGIYMVSEYILTGE